MSAVDFNSRVQAQFDAASARLPGAVQPLAARRSALARLVELGLPALRDDAFRYSNLRPVHAANVRFAPDDASPEALEPFDATTLNLAPALPGAARLLFVDGRLHAGGPAAGAVLPGLRSLPPPVQFAERPLAARFALLNDAFAVDAVRYAIDGERSLEVVFVSTGAAVASYPRIQLELSAGSSLTLVERHLGPGSSEALSSAVTELVLARDARCRWYRVQDLGLTATHLETLRVRLEAGAALEAVLLQLGGGAVRTNLDCELVGRGASLQLQAASLAGDARTLDGVMDVRHLAPDTQSQQELRAIATERASISFRSAVSVGNAATGADSRQSLKGLIAGDAQVNLRPELEIDVDSVRASHGATTGAIDEGMLFYLLSRGLERETARQLLEWAFVEAVIGKVADPSVRREFEDRTVARLGNRAAREVLA